MAEGDILYPAVGGSREVVEGHLGGRRGPSGEPAPDSRAIIDNRTGLPDDQIVRAIEDQWVENAGLQFGGPSSFQLYSNTTPSGSMLARTPFRTPGNVIEEIKLARAVVDTDDDVAAVMGQMIATALQGGISNQHEDEATVRLFDEIAKPKNMGLSRVFREMYRELLIASQVNTLSLFTRSRLSFFAPLATEQITEQLAVPQVGILHAENIRVITNDIFGQGQLAYKVEDYRLENWLDEFFNPRIEPARKAAMRAEEPVTAAVFTGVVHVEWNDSDLFSAGQKLYTLNQRMVHRSTLPKGASPYPRPLLTRNFALLEAKRLLNIMDYALLQGGTNYIVVAKKGSDNLPAQQPEIDNLVDQVRYASRSGVLVGDHRVTIDIITPKLDELLNPAKRKLIGRKVAMALLRIPEQVTPDPGSQGATQELEFTGNTISDDRALLVEHVEGTFYEETATRNKSTFKRGAPSLWFQKIVLAGVKDFYASVLQARDRGDIPRRWAVETLGYSYDAAVAERKREIARGDDEVLTPGNVPFDSPGGGGAGPPDNQQGRPAGSSSDNGRPGSPPGVGDQPASPRPRRVIQRTRGETIRASIDPDTGALIRIGELTAAVLGEYPEAQIGRVTQTEREAMDAGESFIRGPLAVVPVNLDYPCDELRAVRLSEGLSMVVGRHVETGAMVARALTFREPVWSVADAEERTLKWGFYAALTHEPEESEEAKKRKKCKNCGNQLPSYSHLLGGIVACPSCGTANDVHGPLGTSGGPAGGGTGGGYGAANIEEIAKIIAEAVTNAPSPNVVLQIPGQKPMRIIRDEETGAVIGSEPIEPEERND